MNKTSPGKYRGENLSTLFFHQQIVDYRAGAGAGAAILTSWSRVKMEQLHNTALMTCLENLALLISE